MQALSIPPALLDEDAFQDAYLSIAVSCRRQAAGQVFEKAFLTAYQKFSRMNLCESYTVCHPDELFFTMLPEQETEHADQRIEQDRNGLARAVRAHIRAGYSPNDVAAWEMRMGGATVRDIADALGLRRTAVDSLMRRITESTRKHFKHHIHTP